MNKEKGSILITILIVFTIVLILAGGFVFARRFLQSQPTTQTVQTSLQGDINRDGKVNEVDNQFVRGALGCKKDDPCWMNTVGKTSDGDNPIYTSDLDANADSIIDEKDMPNPSSL